MDNKFGTGAMMQNLEKLKRELPVLLANQAQRHFTANFKAQGFEGDHWKEVKRRIEGTPEYKYPKTKGLSRRTSPILVRTGKLRRAVSESIRSKTFTSIKLVAALPYANYQNEGTDTIPKRQFMGDSPQLRKLQTELITDYMKKLQP